MPFEVDVAYTLSFTWCRRHVLTQRTSVDSQQAPESGGRQATERYADVEKAKKNRRVCMQRQRCLRTKQIHLDSKTPATRLSQQASVA